MITKPTYIEQHYSFSISSFEGLWEMTIMDPFNRQEHMSIYVVAPNSDYNAESITDKPIVEAGERLTDVLNHLLYQIEYYPYSWDFSGKKIVTYGYDFETDYNGSNLTEIDLTEIAYKEVNEYYNFFSPLETNAVSEAEKVSGKGVMAKLKITLNKAKHVNHLEIDYFTEYPIELMTLIYESEENNDATFYEIPLSKAVQSSSSLHLHFTPAFAKTFYLIMKQESYTLSSQTQTQEELNQAELWNQASSVSQSIYKETVSDYMNQLFATQSAIQLHQEVLDSYKNTNTPLAEPTADPLNAYRSDFNDIKTKLDSEQR